MSDQETNMRVWKYILETKPKKARALALIIAERVSKVLPNVSDPHTFDRVFTHLKEGVSCPQEYNFNYEQLPNMDGLE